MKTAELPDVQSDLGHYLDQIVTDGPLVITRNGQVVAVVLVPVDADDLERLLLARSPHFQALLQQSRQSIEEGHGLTRDAFWQIVSERQNEGN
ncbi:MAG TPA: type II toxin-antitoxin system prevent-host-death family antitoxin [Roseiflexaceae bacterium]|jgi:prevent-host-death family protein